MYITLLIIVLTWPAIQYPIKIASILGIWTTNFLIPPTDVELMGGHRRTREGDDSIFLRALPKENIILAHYMLSAWWLHLLDGLGPYGIRQGEVSKIMVMTNNIMTLGYTYD